MRHRLVVVLLVFLVGLLLVAGCGGTPSGPRRPAAEKRLPDVTLQAFTGSGSLDLGSLKGPAVVNLWASWCGPCKRELPVYEQFAKRYPGRVRVIGIDFQETRLDAARRLIEQTGVSYPLFTDPDGAMRAIGLPKILLVGADGTVTYEKYAEMTTPDEIADLVRQHLPGTL